MKNVSIQNIDTAIQVDSTVYSSIYVPVRGSTRKTRLWDEFARPSSSSLLPCYTFLRAGTEFRGRAYERFR